MKPIDINRSVYLTDSIIQTLDLNLSEFNILTECGSEIFAITPAIALRAGAKKVMVWSRDSTYGTAEQNAEMCRTFLQKMELSLNKVEFALNERPIEHIQNADIITNLGFVRPLDQHFLSHVKPGTAIPIMCESWEFRETDIDLNYCREKKIRLAGTWENHPDLKIFDGCGYLAAKLCMEAGFEIYQNKIAIWSDDDFGKVILDAIKKFQPNSVCCTQKVSDLKNAELIIIADYFGSKTILGANGILNPDELQGKGIVHLCGEVDHEFAKKAELFIYPDQRGFYVKMTRTLAHLGIKPAIDLHAAGLKVGELLKRNQNHSLAQPIL